MRAWFSKLRESKGFSQKKLAAMVGISQPSLANIESGKTNPRISTAKRIAAVLDFDWTKFFEKS